ncbi:MAG: lysophospholipid acyltransferase family protein [Pirellulales bacterium]
MDLNLTAPVLAFVAKLIAGASVRWVDSQPDTCQRVYFSNHTSHLDSIIIWASLPKHVRKLTRPVAAKDYWERGWFRRHLARSLNAMLIDRLKVKVHQSPVDMMLREMGNEHSLIVFPEGTRSHDGEVKNFKSGIYYLNKKRPDLELIPVYMDNMNRILPSGEFLPVPLLSRVTFGPPIWLEQGETKPDFLKRAREAVLNLKD